MSTPTHPAPRPACALLFPGQGTQQPGMGEPWADTPQWDLVDEISHHTRLDVADLLLHADAETLRRTDIAQVAIYAMSLMALHAVRAAAPDLDVRGCAGHSLGEYTALAAAGAVSVADGARLVAARGTAMQQAVALTPGTMGAVVGGDLDTVRDLVETVRAQGPGVWMANENAPGQAVVSGTVEGVDRVAELAPERRMKVIRLAVAGAFHSPLMEPARLPLRQAVAQALFRDTAVPVVAHVDARPHTRATDWPDLTDHQLVSPVRWQECVRTLLDDLGCTYAIELGPGKTLTGMLRRIAPDIPVSTVGTPDAAALPPPAPAPAAR